MLEKASNHQLSVAFVTGVPAWMYTGVSKAYANFSAIYPKLYTIILYITVYITVPGMHLYNF